MDSLRIEGQTEVNSIIYKKLHLVLFCNGTNLGGEFELRSQCEILFPKLHRRDARPARFSDHLGQGTTERFCAITDQVDFKVN